MANLKKLSLLCITSLIFSFYTVSAPSLAAATTLPEGHDFATLVLKDPWDMSEFSDVSYGIHTGSIDQLSNILVQDGVFSARATANDLAEFFVLFPGFDDAILFSGKVGYLYPINAAKYRCLYMAAKVDSGPPSPPNNPDQVVVYWFNDNSWANPTPYRGQTLPGIITIAGKWQLYKWQLDDPNLGTLYKKWTESPDGVWRGLRIDPTLQATSFAIDWVRLTDCAQVPLTIQWNGSGTVDLYVQPNGTSREIKVGSYNSHPITLDVQGIQPGSYTYFVKTGSTVITSGSFNIEPSPIATINSPSFTSGADYAAQAGNAWDMNEPTDVKSIQCSTYSFQNSLLKLDTPTFANQPSQCRGGSVSDPIDYLNVPVPVDTTQYRYLSFRIYQDGAVQDFGSGMIARWGWQVLGTSGLPNNRCIMVTGGIPLDVGWHTYSVDLLDPVNGVAVQQAGECRPGTLTWQNTYPALELRFDPNENISGRTFHQEIDWIQLTKMDQVARGVPYSIKFTLNKPWSPSYLTTIYYTTTLTQPNQHLALQYIPSIPPTWQQIFLPLLEANGTPPVGNGVTFLWDTASVPAGLYYICVNANDLLNSATYCSEAPVWVY